MSKRWTRDEIIKVKLIANGAPNVKLQRSPVAIANKIRELGLKTDRRYELWTQEEIELLKQGKPIGGRSAESINRKRISLGLHKRPPRIRWPQQDINRLRQLCEQGHSALDIYKNQLLPARYSINSIQKKMCRLGLAKKSKAKYMRFPEHIKFKFERFLKNNWKNKIPEELADMWNAENYDYQIGRRRVIRYLTLLNIKVSCYEVAKMKRLRAKEQKLKDELDNSRLLDDSIKAERIKLMRDRYVSNKDIWSGK